MRVQYVLTEVFNNIRRNALVVLGAILAVFISLFLVFGTLIFGEIARINSVQWGEDVRVVAYLRDDFTDVTSLQQEIGGWAEVQEVFFVSKPEAYQEALELLKNRPSALRVIEDSPQIVPASLRIKPVELGGYDAIASRLQNLPGVMQVESAIEAVDQIEAIRDGLRVFFWLLAVALGVAAVALIANTIHMAIYARREELEIMKLVGASNWFVRTPFLLEGMIEGLLGAAVAAGVGVGLFQLSLRSLEGLPQYVTIDVSNQFLARWSLVILGFGVVVGLIGSSLSLAFHRYIRT
jgi:cell division transport system permease protein